MLDFIFQQSVLETIVIVGIVIAIIGVFWKIILIGGSALFCLSVLAKHLPPIEVKPSVEIVKPYQQNQEVIKEVIVSPTPVKQVDPRRDEYVSDCVSYGFAKQWCKDNWDNKLEKEE
jgi:hypothetical protein